MLDLFGALDESVKSDIYTKVQDVVCEEKSFSVGSDDYIEINGSLVSLQDESLGKLIVNADPLGRRVQLGIEKWLG